MEDFKHQVKKGFEKCKLDIEEVKDDNSNLKNELNSLKEENLELKSSINELKAELKGLKIAIDYIKDLSKTAPAMQQPQQQPQQTIEQPVVEQTQATSHTQTPIHKPQTQAPKKDPYEALLAFKAKANKREVLKQKMLTIIGENGLNLSELKFLFVEHYNYCSKATFYNYLKELELSSQIKIERDNGKNTVYLTHLISREI